MNNKLLLWITAIVAATLTSCGESVPKLGKASIDDVIAAMTTEEKAHFVIGTGSAGVAADSASIGYTKHLVPGAAGTSYPIPRLGIPAVVLADGPAGLRIEPTREGEDATYYCTHFPVGTLLASTWDQELVESVGQAMGEEVLEYGADVLLAPALNIQRNPLCGRNFEYFSEDPVVSGKIAAAYVRGVQSNGVGTSVKHFAANNQETNRLENDAVISKRALREIYLKGFEIVVKEAQPWTVMSSYNCLNGEYTSEKKELLTDVLRDDWGFEGMVMTDWHAGTDALGAMKAGNDMLQPGMDGQYETILEGLESGTLDEAVIDRNIKRILEMILKTPRFKGYAYSNKPDLKAHAEVTRQSATEGMVLLKNDAEALPMNKDIKKVALFGCTSYDFIAGGTGSGDVNHAYVVSLVDGLKNAGYEIDENLKNDYESHITYEREHYVSPFPPQYVSIFGTPRPKEKAFTTAELSNLASSADVAIITIGRNSGELFDRKVADFSLTKEEVQLMKGVTTAFHAAGKKVIVVLNVGGAIETASWKNMPDAILCAWQAGQEGGNSVVDVLSGKATPSGKLAVTFPIKLDDAPSAENYPHDMPANFNYMKVGKTRKHEVKNVDFTNYEEDIYVGYRYYDTFDKPVSYPFGYGLSYTTFAYSNPTVNVSDGTITATVDIENVGNRAGKEVVQLYTSAPDAATANKPAKELKAFAKTNELKPGEKETVRLELKTTDLASFDEDSSSWVVSRGTHKILIGSSSQDIRTSLEVNAEPASIKVSDVLSPNLTLNTLKR